jgi:exodeoxyribonuclease VII small subunit
VKRDMNFEQALGKLENIVRTLEVGDVKLEEALKLFEEGSALSKKCLDELDKIQRRLEVLKVVDGKVLRIPMDDGPAGSKAIPAPVPLDDDEEE